MCCSAVDAEEDQGLEFGRQVLFRLGHGEEVPAGGEEGGAQALHRGPAVGVGCGGGGGDEGGGVLVGGGHVG